jgi:hypothetical protein
VASSTSYIGYGESPYGNGSWGLDLIEVSVDGVASSGQVGTVTLKTINRPVAVGVEATGQIGEEEIDADAFVPVTGVEGTVGLGSVAVKINFSQSAVGVQATGIAEGEVACPTFQGWGANGWGEGAWDSEITEVCVTGNAALGTVGSVTTTHLSP